MADQPLPVRNFSSQPVTAEVIADLRAREQRGIETYSQTLHTHNGRDALRDLYEELLDGARYAKQAMMERDSAKPAVTAMGAPVGGVQIPPDAVYQSQPIGPIPASEGTFAKREREAMESVIAQQVIRIEAAEAVCRLAAKVHLNKGFRPEGWDDDLAAAHSEWLRVRGQVKRVQP